jgi:hypothetical protein
MNLLYGIPLLFGFILNIISSNSVKNKAELMLTEPYKPLPDIIHYNFPKINTIVPDYFLLSCMSLIIYYNNNLNKFEKHLLCIGLCTIIRSFSICLTIFPTCMPKLKDNNSYYQSIFHSSHDLMFSGHTLFFIAIGQVLDNYTIQIIGPLLLVLARQHYTIDICVSGLVYYFVYNNLNVNYPYLNKL